MSKEKTKKVEMIKVKPLKDFSFYFGSKYHMKKEVEISIPKVMEANLKSEKVIK